MDENELNPLVNNEQTEAPAAPATDPRLQSAIDEQNKRQNLATLLRSFQTVLQASAPQSGFKADMSMADSMEKRASEPVEQYKTQLAQESAARKEARDAKESQLRQDDFQLRLEKSRLDFQDMQANRDPASQQSKIAQDRVLEVRAKMGQPLNEAAVRQQSGEQLFKTFDFLKEDLTNFYKNENARLEREKDISLSKDRLSMEAERNKKLDAMEERRIGKEARAEKEGDRRYRQQQINTARGMIKDDPRFKKSMEQAMAFEDVDQLLQQAENGNEQAVGALGTKLARAMGEVGVLTDTDVVRYVAGQSWGRKLKDWFTKGATGELSPETVKGIKANLKILKEKMGGDVKRVVDNSALRMKAAYPEMEDDDIRGILGFQNQATESTSSSGKYGDVVERDGKRYKWNPTAPNEKTGKPGAYQIIGD